MASTNQTTHYELSQYIATDKPTYLVDYNGDMSKIDAGIYGAKSLADTNEASIGTLSNLDTTVKSDLVSAINEVNTQVGLNTTAIGNNTTAIGDNTTAIGTLANLSTTVKSDLVSATNEVNSKVGNIANLDTSVKTDTVSAINELVSEFNFSSFDNYTNTSDIVVSGAVPSALNVYRLDVTVAKNTSGSLAKVYGRMTFSTDNTQGGANPYTIKLNVDTGLRPSSAITINALGIRHASVDNAITPVPVTINTDGTIDLLTSQTFGGSQTHTIVFSPCLLFIKDFGDTPINP